MCRQPFQAQTIGALEPVHLSFKISGPLIPDKSFRLAGSQCRCLFLCSLLRKEAAIMQTLKFEVFTPYLRRIDVHKKSLIAAVCVTDPVTLEANYFVKVFNSSNSDIAALRDWLLAQDCHDVCMESTGKYWIPIFNILDPYMNMCLPPKYVKAINSKKPTNVMQNEYLIYSALISSKLLLSPLLTSMHCVNYPNTASNSPICILPKRTITRTA